MERKGRKRGSVTNIRGKLHLRLYWRHPEDPFKEYRWSIQTHQAATEANRQLLTQRLEAIDAKIRANAFFPCQEFPDTKIASFCHCELCGVVEPLANAQHAPRSLKQLLQVYQEHERQRATGDQRIIEYSSFDTKMKAMKACYSSFSWFDAQQQELCDVSPLADYDITELTPDAVQTWLYAFQHREELLTKNKAPASSSWMNNILSAIRGALKMGQMQRWWRTHPLLEYSGNLIETTKAERHRQRNRTLNKPFSINERDRIINWFYHYWQDCPIELYNSREKPRRLMLYAYVVIGFNTGLRSPSEITALEWDDIDFSLRRVMVRKSREASGRIDQQGVRNYTKTVQHREVPLNDAAVAALRLIQPLCPENQSWVFWNPRADASNPGILSNGWAPLTGEKRIRYTFNKCLNALKIHSEDNQGQYRMRHTFVTLVLDTTKMSDSKVAYLIGDNVETMERHYKGHCRNRWRDEGDYRELNALNQIKPGRLQVLK